MLSFRRLLFCARFALATLAATIVALPARAEPPANLRPISVAPAPQWVKPFAVDKAATADPGDAGYSMLLIDRQANIDATLARYYHEVRKIVSPNGLQDGAIIGTTLNPEFETLTFHNVTVTRDGRTSNRLDASRIKLFSRQTDAERAVYDFDYTIQYQLEDVQVGDVIEFAFTTVGTNPIKRQKFYTAAGTQFKMSTARCITGYRFPSARSVKFLGRNRPLAPSITQSGGTTDWTLDDANVTGRALDTDCPADYEPRASVLVSEFGDWHEVVVAMLPFFAVNERPQPQLQGRVASLLQIGEPDKRVEAALRFVQNEIRNVTFATDIAWHKPASADEVARRRFGDSKDKALLLVYLLRAAGVDADAALISSTDRAALAGLLPSPGVFDGVIVQARTRGGTHWLDPTREQQRGPLDQIYIAPFGAALVLNNATNSLTAFEPPPPSLPWKKVIETYRIPAPEGGAFLEVVTEFHGRFADNVRKHFAVTPPDEIQKGYVNFYARRYPDTQAHLGVLLEEIPDADTCRVREAYDIPKIWKLSDDNKSYALSIYPADLDSSMDLPGTNPRRDPLALDGPFQVEQQTHVQMFEDWPVEAETDNVNNEFFRFGAETKGEGSEVDFSYHYELPGDRVSAADFPRYRSALSAVEDKLGYRFTHTTPAQLNRPQAWRGLNWSIVVWFFTVTGAAAYAGWRYFCRTKLPSAGPPPLPGDAAHEGIAGWLVLVAIGLVSRPLYFLHAAYIDVAAVGNLERWHAVTTPGEGAYHPLWAPTLLFESLYNLIGVLFALLTILLFFKKRFAWRRTYVALLLYCALGAIVDAILTSHIPAAEVSLRQSIRDIMQPVVAAAIWIPYTVRSKRVKATFRY